MKFFLHYFPMVQISLSFPALSPFWKRRMLKSARRLLHQRFCCCGHWFSGGQNRISKVRESEGGTGDIPPAVYGNLLECPRRSAASNLSGLWGFSSPRGSFVSKSLKGRNVSFGGNRKMAVIVPINEAQGLRERRSMDQWLESPGADMSSHVIGHDLCPMLLSSVIIYGQSTFRGPK